MSSEASVEVSAAQQDNPFQANGELRRKADYIISHSRISRTEVQIVDPDSPQPTTELPAAHGEDVVVSASCSVMEAEAPPQVSNSLEVQVNSRDSSNGKAYLGETVGQGAVVEAEVKKAETKTEEHPQKAEQIKLKSKKCCSVQ